MIEVLNSATAVDENGDVLPIDDVWLDIDYGPDEIDKEVARDRAGIFDVQQGIALQKARSGDFSGRNRALVDAAVNAGKANQSWGAGLLHVMGRGDKIRGASTAAERALRQGGLVRQLAKLACEACPLAMFCDMTSEEVAERLLATGKDGQDARRRLRSRIGGEKTGANRDFCRNNLSDQRLPKV